MTQNLSAELGETLDELIQLLSSLDQRQLNTAPFEDSWTAAQLGEHLLQSYNMVREMIHTTTEPTQRAIDKYVEQIKADFLDLDTKMESPDFIKPRDMLYAKEAVIANLSHTRVKLVAAVDTLDASLTCTMWPFPGYGYLTRLELYCFMLYHTQRHIHQLRKIVAVVKV